VVLWWSEDPALVRREARAAIEEGRNDVLVSAASVWEAAIKVAVGRLRMPIGLDDAASLAGFAELAIGWRHARTAASLPQLHADPFDRMLVAQALDEGLVLVTRDRAVQQYPVPTLLA
jgi:PIN domain nuclease of toxin-antitoxin system